MKSIGIITIHKINNYGSVLQAYALQEVCKRMGYQVEIIDYDYPNEFHINNKYSPDNSSRSNEPRLIKLLFAKALLRQHKGIREFVKEYESLSPVSYHSPSDLETNPPKYDCYITGSDQLWSPRHCNGDTSFLLKFAPDNALKISYASSIGSRDLPEDLIDVFSELLNRYNSISTREQSGAELIYNLIGKKPSVVLDPTLLLRNTDWDKIATPKRIIKEKYILCYFLNYSFNAFPYVDEMAKMIQRETGYKIVRVARPPHKLFSHNTVYKIGASPEEFLALIRDAEIVLTTSFHGTAFAANFGKPLLSVVKREDDSDSRQVSFLQSIGLQDQIVTIQDEFPKASQAFYNIRIEQEQLDRLRESSLKYLFSALSSLDPSLKI